MKQMKMDFFLGANGPDGFYSLYEELGRVEETRDLMILTGGPGAGKSTLMKKLGREGEKLGLRVEYIHCSGDPNSLDAVRFPELGIAAADGTAPHILTPRYPAAVDRILDLGRFYDVDRLKTHRAEIMETMAGCHEAYAKAYRCLRARRSVLAELEAEAAQHTESVRLRRRLMNAWERRRGKKRPAAGTVYRRLLSSPTPAGRCTFPGTIYTLCNTVYALRDPYHVGAASLAELCRRVTADGYDAVACLDPDAPARIAHVLVPEKKLAFVTEDRSFALPAKAERTIHVERMMDREALRAAKSSIRLKERLAGTLEAEGMSHLSAAGEKHDALEAIYRPYVDFDGISKVTEQELARLRRVCQKKKA